MTSHGRFIMLLAVLAALACKAADEAPKLPLGHPPIASDGASSTAAAPLIEGEAKAALDSGNALYKAKAFPLALNQYRRAADLAPSEEAPLFGMLMVASSTGDAGLADSVTALMRALRPQPSSDTRADSVLAGVHSGVLPPSHPPLPPRSP
ncbi:MAG TPA: hypothetical protein VMM77_05855 [Gemmatimonadaceae bacterium]|nr:hypothetical protein [Gemmatimonadaceae bacterium]